MGGENSKLAFRKCAFRLAEQRSLPDSAEDAWSPFWLLPESPHDVFSLVTPADIRRIRDSARENFIKLIDKVFDRLLILKAAKDLTKLQTSTKQLLNCVRILTRLVPFAYEACPDGSTVEDILLWTPRPRPGSGADYILGKQLVSAAIDLLFTSGFTVPPATVGEDAVVRYAIWENGIGQTSSLGSSKDHVSNRVEVLRLVLVLSSKTMYVPPAMAAAAPNRALHAVAYNSNKRMVLGLLCSLLNTSLKDRTQGWAIPYRNTSTMDPNDTLSLQAMQTLFVLLEYQAPSSAGNDAATESPVADTETDNSTPSMVLVTGTETGPQNLFRVFTAKLHRTQEFDYLVGGIIRLLEEAMRSNLSLLASVTKQPTRSVMPQEATILLWMLLEANAPFKDYLVDHNSSLKLFSALMYFMLSGYNDPAQAGMVRTISHIIHCLSEDSRFATRLMQPFDQSILPSTMRIVDANLTHADFMINTVYTLLSSSKPHLVPVYSSLLLLMRNVSPYLTQVSQTTADKLVSLFDIISSPAFIISEPYHVRWLIYLIEVFDYVIHYRAADNPHLIYSMIQARACFTRLKSFDLDKARAELLALRERKGKSEAARTIGKALPPLPSTPYPGVIPPDAATGPVSASASTSNVSEAAAVRDDQGTISPAISDKARGKRPDPGPGPVPAKEENQQNNGLTPPSAPVAAKSGIGSTTSQQFQPSTEWVFSWLPDLPLDPIITVLEALAVCTDNVAEKVQRDAESVTAQLDGAMAGMDVKDGGHPAAHLSSPKSSNVGDFSSTLRLTSVDPTAAIMHWLGSEAMVKAMPDLEESMPEIRPRLQIMSPTLVVWSRSLLWSLIYGSGMKPFGIWKNTQVRLFLVKSN
ncbi:hypothetical protein H4S07_002698 [Coemansia furcata]|uniref:Uncharacterized protein n=1 Tax=Coemansia furcata TaxID=417177 RepID=A0ACC1LK41_9FUNG|nr:hypothetical protein H4S07_002698 [Coemansia furcata]